jgi:hypothetical protein
MAEVMDGLGGEARLLVIVQLIKVPLALSTVETILPAKIDGHSAS